MRRPGSAGAWGRHEPTRTRDHDGRVLAFRCLRWIAQLGGFLGRKCDGEPDVKVPWRGFRILQVVVEDWRIFNPDP